MMAPVMKTSSTAGKETRQLQLGRAGLETRRPWCKEAILHRAPGDVRDEVLAEGSSAGGAGVDGAARGDGGGAEACQAGAAVPGVERADLRRGGIAEQNRGTAGGEGDDRALQRLLLDGIEPPATKSSCAAPPDRWLASSARSAATTSPGESRTVR